MKLSKKEFNHLDPLTQDLITAGEERIHDAMVYRSKNKNNQFEYSEKLEEVVSWIRSRPLPIERRVK